MVTIQKRKKPPVQYSSFFFFFFFKQKKNSTVQTSVTQFIWIYVRYYEHAARQSSHYYDKKVLDNCLSVDDKA